MTMTDDEQLERVAELFKALGTVSRLRILTSLARGEGSVSSLVEATGLSQPLVSQHLRVLRSINLVTVSRSGREAFYALTDDHVAHVIDDAVAHAVEASPTTDHNH
jgi:DNA-binding transcriptional ArsR family regulator